MWRDHDKFPAGVVNGPFTGFSIAFRILLADQDFAFAGMVGLPAWLSHQKCGTASEN